MKLKGNLHCFNDPDDFSVTEQVVTWSLSTKVLENPAPKRHFLTILTCFNFEKGFGIQTEYFVPLCVLISIFFSWWWWSSYNWNKFEAFLKKDKSSEVLCNLILLWCLFYIGFNWWTHNQLKILFPIFFSMNVDGAGATEVILILQLHTFN